MSWQIDPAHSAIEFSVRHLMITNVRGQFDKFGGSVDFDEQNPTQTKVNVQIEAASINTKAADRDNHLRSADFLDAANHPYLTFVSKNVALADKSHARLTGDLTIRGVTKPVVLDVEYVGSIKNPWGMTSAGFNARTKINRKDWGLEWNVALETGGMLVGDDITVSIEVELIKVQEQAPAAAATA
jgi:polyisoprenoid-binding protein YceI